MGKKTNYNASTTAHQAQHKQESSGKEHINTTGIDQTPNKPSKRPFYSLKILETIYKLCKYRQQTDLA